MIIKHNIKTDFKIDSPKSLKELKTRLQYLVGKEIQDLCNILEIPVPKDSTHAKGFTGQILEILLGANAGNLPIPDFSNLNIELKTIPCDANLKPLESTFICHCDLLNRENDFYKSTLYHKMSFILFVFILAPKDLPIANRKILSYYFFMPDETELKAIKNDYDEIMGMISSGHAHEITAHFGEIIQLRPKSADGKQLTDYINEDGKIAKTRPRGFYMRRSFSQQIANKCKSY